MPNIILFPLTDDRSDQIPWDEVEGYSIHDLDNAKDGKHGLLGRIGWRIPPEDGKPAVWAFQSIQAGESEISVNPYFSASDAADALVHFNATGTENE